jgi:RNA binding exosome subunit
LDKETLNSEMKLHLEKRNLYLRFDKQSAYMGELKFSSNAPIHFKIHFKNKTPEEITAICREAGLLP